MKFLAWVLRIIALIMIPGIVVQFLKLLKDFYKMMANNNQPGEYIFGYVLAIVIAIAIEILIVIGLFRTANKWTRMANSADESD